MKFTIDVVKIILSEFRLKKDGTFGKINSISISDDDFVFNDYYEAKKWKSGHDTIEVNGEMVKVNPTVSNFTDYYVRIRCHRTSKPKNYLITRDELKTLLINGDDNQNNSLIIDFDGFLKLMPFDEAIKYPYAVRFESFQAGNGYVGSNSSLNHLENTYLALLQGWAEHLASSEMVYRDYTDNKSEEEIKDKIMESIKQYK